MDAFLFNCTDPTAISVALEELVPLTNKPTGAYPNRFRVPSGWTLDNEISVEPTEMTVEQYLEFVGTWRRSGATIIGGCCGVGPEFICCLVGLIEYPTMAIPVILDTDIGTDVDDVWALAFLLRCPELDIRLNHLGTGDTHHRAALVAKLLGGAGRDDVPIGVGLPLDPAPLGHTGWLGDYSLEDYPGPVFADGVGAICDTVMSSADPVTIIGIGPLPNIAAALVREPRLTERSSFVGMHGSLRRGYLGAPKPMREYNVKQHALACQAVFTAPWHKTITPLDTCGNILLQDQYFAAVAQSTSPLAQAVMANPQEWFEVASSWPMLGDLLRAMIRVSSRRYFMTALRFIWRSRGTG